MVRAVSETGLARDVRDTDQDRSGPPIADHGDASPPVSATDIRAESPAKDGARPTLTPELVFASHFDFVWRSLRRLGVAPSALDDAVQEVFVVVCRRLHTLRDEPQLRPWLFSIAAHVARRAWRTGKRRSAEPLPEVLADERSLSPQEAASRAEAVRVVYALLDQLSPSQRSVFVLAHLEQFTAPEIAAALDMPVNTVYSRLRASRAAIEAALDRHRARSREVRLIGTESA